MVCVPTYAGTIELRLPEFNAPAGLPILPWYVGTFSFTLGRAETILDATLFGAFGNSSGESAPLTTVYADGIRVGQMPAGPHILIFPFPWTFSFSEPNLPLLSDGRLVITTSGVGPFFGPIHLAETRLRISTVPEPATIWLVEVDVSS